ncbi:MAG: hypothetical protein ACFBSE_17100 [Prochloraceae cyanobacterium]
MFRLNDRAYKILKTEVERCAAKDEFAGDVQKNIVLKQLEQMRSQRGNPATATELSHIVSIYPNFRAKVIDRAAKANQTNPSYLGIITIAAGSIVSLAGIVWLINLPYPMIRRPVAKVAPILLLPSYISMDRNYREAISNVEEAEQLVNRATSGADIELGDKKVQTAQKNLDALPVWFLGYEPKFYCSLLSCNWRFTFDEFETARKRIGRMKGVVFQERNALNELKNTEREIEIAKQEYKNAPTKKIKQQAIDAWQIGIDKIEQLPPSTLAGKQGSTKLRAYERDFEKVVGYLAGNNRTSTLIKSAQQFAIAATDLGEEPPLKYYEWQQKEQLWFEAIALLERVDLSDPNYVKAQTLLAEYKTELAKVRIEKQKEKESIAALEEAQDRIERLLANNKYDNRERIISQLQGIIDRLETVQPGTTAYPKARQLLTSAEQRLAQFQQ